MKIKHFAIYGLIFLTIQIVNLSVIDTAQTFTCSEGGFSIWMPGEPALQQVNHKSFAGNIIEITYTLKTETTEFGSSYTELPGIAVSFLSDKALLTKAKNGFLKDAGVQEISFEKIIFEGKEGRELVFKIPSENNSNATSGKARFYLFGKRLYVVMVTTTQGAEGDGFIDRYLNSFKLISTVEK